MQACISVPLKTEMGGTLAIEYVVDTGFTGFLSLPPAAIAALGLPLVEEIPANLANDTEVFLAVHGAVILWDGLERPVRVVAMGRRPLLGTALLRGCALGIEFVENGMVAVAAI